MALSVRRASSLTARSGFLTYISTRTSGPPAAQRSPKLGRLLPQDSFPHLRTESSCPCPLPPLSIVRMRQRMERRLRHKLPRDARNAAISIRGEQRRGVRNAAFIRGWERALQRARRQRRAESNQHRQLISKPSRVCRSGPTCSPPALWRSSSSASRSGSSRPTTARRDRSGRLRSS